jgi:hypothetical protein
MRSHRAVGQIMARYGADAITIQCLMLEHRNLVIYRRNGWERCEGARLSFTDCSVPILEV